MDNRGPTSVSLRVVTVPPCLCGLRTLQNRCFGRVQQRSSSLSEAHAPTLTCAPFSLCVCSRCGWQRSTQHVSAREANCLCAAHRTNEARRALFFSVSTSYCKVRSLPPAAPLTLLANTASVNLDSFFVCCTSFFAYWSLSIFLVARKTPERTPSRGLSAGVPACARFGWVRAGARGRAYGRL